MTFLEVKSLIKNLMELSRCVNSLVTTFDMNLSRINDNFSGFKIHFEASNFLLQTTDYSNINLNKVINKLIQQELEIVDAAKSTSDL
jgi:hypothetical protein